MWRKLITHLLGGLSRKGGCQRLVLKRLLSVVQVSVDEENQAIRESIIFERKKVFKETEEKVQARWKFEDNIKRPYFHMKSLERSQLKNWSEYLKVESERNQDTLAVEIL